MVSSISFCYFDFGDFFFLRLLGKELKLLIMPKREGPPGWENLERVRRPVLVMIAQQENWLGSNSAAGSPCQACKQPPPVPKASVSLLSRPGALPEITPRVRLQTVEAIFAETGLAAWVRRFWPRPLRRRPLPQALAGLSDSLQPRPRPASNTPGLGRLRPQLLL